MHDLMAYIWSIDNLTMFMVAVLATWGGYIVHQMISSHIMTMLFVPGFVVGAVLSNYIFGKLGVFILHDKDSNALVVTAIGMMAALVVMIVGIWLTHTVTEMTRPSVADRRAREGR
ncbi:MAG: hypothetical protein AB1749_06800 [Pseudomonadota bacterium]